MPRSIQNTSGLTLRKLISSTYHYMRSRYEYRDRDVLKKVIVKEVAVYDGRNIGEARTKFIIETSSYPQYYPYYTRRDSRGRRRSRQRTYKHQYNVYIQMDRLSLDSDRFKIRTGSDSPWDFSERGKSKKDRRGRIIEGTNIKEGRNGDHFFRLSWLRYNSGILFGRNFANGPPNEVNPQMIHFLTKHELQALEFLVNRQILQ